MGKASSEVSPTRMALLQLRKKTKLAKRGHSLLKEKRDAIVMQFFEKMDVTREAREKVNDLLTHAYQDLTLAQASAGSSEVFSASLAVSEIPELDMSHRNIMGVKIPTIGEIGFSRKVTDRGYGLLDTNSRIDIAAKDFEEVLSNLVKLAEYEHSLRLLATEIKKTKRRVNALEYLTIPKLERSTKHIRMRLDEMERENFFRLKIIKRRLDNAAS